MSRKKAREKVYQLVFEYVFNRTFNSRTLEIVSADANLSGDDVEFIAREYKGITDDYPRLEQLITSHTPGYSGADRLATTDLAAMVIAAYELTSTDVPAAVAINEAVDLVKIYGTEKSSGFVNGVLASVLKDAANG